ncbi:protein chain elongation factor EF-G, GTP-binding [Bradyrhizobium sp. ORS 278]|nr:protein chain elongation factor EF-G, GTP-binding [Bradyrhizobium sp. ORS 278]
MAHVDAGKTTLTERILLDTGKIHQAGDVHTGNTETDSHALEKKHGITISAAAISCEWRDAFITIIDTPGHVDFQIEVERSLRVLDGAIAVFSAVSGVEPQSETVWRQADRLGVPRLCFVNKMDQVGADLQRTVEMIADRLGATPLVLQLPLRGEDGFAGVVDLVAMKALYWDGAQPQPSAGAIPEELRSAAERQRQRLLETLADQDAAIMAAYVGGETISAADLKAAIRRACLAGRLTPVLCGSAYRNVGVHPLLDAIVDYAPGPEDRPAVAGLDPRSGAAEHRLPRADQPFAALVSKVQASRFGTLAFVRVYAGRVTAGTSVTNATSDRTERIGRLLRMQADAQIEIDEARAGDVVAVVGLKSVVAGDTLSDPAHPIVLDGFVIPEPVIEAVVEPRLGQDQERLGQALALMARSDPSLRVVVDADSGQTLLRGMGELHLQIAVERLKEDYNVDAVIGAPEVAYRAAASRPSEVDHTLRKQSGGPGQMARVRLAFAPLEEGGEGLVFVDETVGGAIPREFIPSIEKALRQSLRDGGPGGYPVLGQQVTLLDGAFHQKDSSGLAFELATREAFRIGFERAAPILLEPVMRVVVTTPEDYLGGIIGDLQSRRGRIVATEPIPRGQEVIAEVPLARLFNYVSALRSLSQGRAVHAMAFSRYAPAPIGVAEKLIATA